MLRAECDFMPWATAVIYFIPKAGHFIQFEQPELILSVIRAFLPEVVAPYTEDADPSRAAPARTNPTGDAADARRHD